MRVAGLVLAAGAATRFGGPKMLARLDGRPILEHVLRALRDAGVGPIVVVLGREADAVEAAVAWQDEHRVRVSEAGPLSGSLAAGMTAIGGLVPPPDGVLIALGDQPRTRPSVLRMLLGAAAGASAPPVTVPRYADGDARNPVVLRRDAFHLTERARGDRGLGPVLSGRGSIVQEVPIEGGNPDVDTPADLTVLAWADRVRANREQVDRLREVPDGDDFYAPVRELFRADPRRADDPVLDRLRSLANPEDVWLDIGAGAGRYALPLARTVREVVALDPSAAMLAALRDQATDEGISNVRTIEGRWPPSAGDAVARALGVPPCADVALIAHLGYDVERIGPFVAAMEVAARRLCVAVLMERTPAAAAEPVWERVHGEARARLPALPDFTALLDALGRTPSVTIVDQAARTYPSREALEVFLRRQLWIADGGEKERRFHAAIEELAERRSDGWVLRGQPPGGVGVVSWEPPAAPG